MARSLTLIAVVIGIAYFVTVVIGIDNLREKVEGAGIFAPLIVILLKATTIVVAPLGGAIIYPIAGAVFGFWTGLLYTFIGDALGSTLAFYISRYFGRSVLHYFTAPSQRPVVDQVLERLSTRASFAKARVYFAGFMDLFAYAAGLTRIPYWFFILVHMAVQLPIIALYVIFGDVLVSGEWYYIVLFGVLMSALAAFGAWRFNIDLSKGA